MNTELISQISTAGLDLSNYTLSLAKAALDLGVISDLTYQTFINGVFIQLAKHIHLYTSGESDSVMNETAAALLGSILYNCDLALSKLPTELAVNRLFSESVESIYFDGLKINRELILKALSMIRRIKRTRVNVMCVYYNNVLNNDLERIVRSYDPKFDAKRNLTDVDYRMPTLNRSVRGIGGILHLLEELQSENGFVNSFPECQTKALFDSHLSELAHPAGDMLNLGQLCFENAILSLIATGEPTIPVSDESIKKLISMNLGDDAYYSALAVSHKLASRAPERYLTKLLENLRPHLPLILKSEPALRRFLGK